MAVDLTRNIMVSAKAGAAGNFFGTVGSDWASTDMAVVLANRWIAYFFLHGFRLLSFQQPCPSRPE